MNAEKEQWTQQLVEIIPDIRRWIHRFTGNQDDTDEVLQQTLMKAIENLASFSEPFNLRSWLMTIARNQSMTYLKQQGRHVSVSSMMLECNTTAPTQERIDPSVAEKMAELPYSSQMLLFMRYFTHHKVAELSRLFKLPEGTVKRRLHEARAQLKEKIAMSESTPPKAPLVRIESVENPEQTTITRAGYGLFFGAPLKGVGDVERVEGYEHPGRIHTFVAECEVTRKATILGHEVWETCNHYSKRAGEKERFLYYAFENGEISMPFRILHFSEPDMLKIDIDQKELVQPTRLEITAPSSEVSGDEIIERDIVHVTIGEKRYENCIRIRSLDNDVHGRCFSESFINQDGREVIHHTYISEGWKMGGFVTWEKWKDAPEVSFRDEKFRLWFEFLLVE